MSLSLSLLYISRHLIKDLIKALAIKSRINRKSVILLMEELQI